MRRIAVMIALAAAGCASSGFNPASLGPQEYDRAVEERFQYGPPEPAAPEMADARAGRIADAEYFRRFPEFERAYTPAARAEAQRLADQLVRDAGDLTTDQFTLRVAEIVALADNAHSHTGPAFKKNTRRVPLRTYWFPDGLYVMRAAVAHRELLGARIDTIDGIPVEQVFQRIRRYNGGTDIWRRGALTPMLESPGLLNAAGVTNDPVALTYAGVRADGQRFEQRIEGEVRGQAAPIQSTTRLILPGADAAMPSFFSRDAQMPMGLRGWSSFFRVEAMDRNGLYVEVAHGDDTDDEPIGDFLERATARIETDRPDYVVIDLRLNSGGDFTKTTAFARRLPLLTRRVYVLTSGWTLSSAMHMAAAIEQAAPERVTFVGSPVGDRLQFWSEGGAFVLPNTPLIASYTAGMHNFAAPCRDYDRCFWLSAEGGDYQVQVRSLDPDIEAPLTFAAYRERRDPAMEAVLAAEARRGSSAGRR